MQPTRIPKAVTELRRRHQSVDPEAGQAVSEVVMYGAVIVGVDRGDRRRPASARCRHRRQDRRRARPLAGGRSSSSRNASRRRRLRGDRGEGVVVLVLATGFVLLLVAQILNVIVFSYGKGTVRTALDEAAPRRRPQRFGRRCVRPPPIR